MGSVNHIRFVGHAVSEGRRFRPRRHGLVAKRLKRVLLALTLLMTLASVPVHARKPVPHAQSTLTERNRAIITDFADLFYRRKDVKAAFEKYVAPDYIQHNPGVADGRDAAITALSPMFARPDSRFDVKRIIVDGNLAVIHLHGQARADTAGGAVTDIYRLADGKIVEHWDVLQPMPTASKNPHPMF